MGRIVGKSLNPMKTHFSKMKPAMCLSAIVVMACVMTAHSQQVLDTSWQSAADIPRVTAPPEEFFQKIREADRDAARQFYKKYIDVKGMPVSASADVDDTALQRTYYIVTRLLAGRPDVIQSMVSNNTRLIIIGKDQVYTDMPEYRHSRDPAYKMSACAALAVRQSPVLARKTCCACPSTATTTKALASMNFVTPSTGHFRELTQPGGSDCVRHINMPLRMACGSSLTPAQTRPNTGRKFLKPTSTITGSIIGTTVPLARVSS